MRLIIIGVFSLLISACWQQDEVISIESGGNVKWLVIAKPDWEMSSLKGVKDELASYSAQMRRAGWTVRSKGTVVEEGDVVLGLSANLQKVSPTTDFYKIHSVNQTMVKIEFLCPIVDDYRVYRTIKFKNSNRSVLECGAGVQTFRY